jgi:PadR family transcriptional regulator, regulatory protein PadR
MENNNDPVQNILLELRRGVLAIAVLSQLNAEQYGYSLLKLLSDQGLTIDQGTLYPLLRRLEAQGLLHSDWRIVDEVRPRRYYVISPQGQTALAQLKQEWANTVAILNKMFLGR